MITCARISNRIRRSLEFRARSAKQLLANAYKIRYRTLPIENTSIFEVDGSCGTKSALLSTSHDAVWRAMEKETIPVARPEGVSAAAGTQNKPALEASLSELSFEAPAILFGRFHNCVAEPHSIRLLTRDDRLIAETAAIYELLDPGYRASGHLAFRGAQVHRLRRAQPYIDRDVLFAFNAFSPSFGHYLLTGLPIVASFFDEIKQGSLKVVIPTSFPQWMTRILLEFGLTDLDLLYLPPSPYRFRSAIVSNILDASNTRAPHPHSLRWTYDFLHDAQPGLNGKIYVRRSSAENVSSRTITNESEVIRALESRGFHIIEPTKMSLFEQANAFRQATVIVSPHGSSLTNLIFCRPGVKVLDLMPDSWVGVRGDRMRDVWGLRVCSLMALRYSVLLTPSTVVEKHFTGNPTILSEVPVPALLDWVETHG